MAAGHRSDEGSTLFRPDFASAGSVDAAILWAILRQAMGDGFSAQRTWLIRWGEMAGNDTRARDLVESIRTRSPADTLCLRYDATSVLVLAVDAAWPGPGSAGEVAGGFEIWRAVDVADEGIRFVPLAADASAEAAEPPAASAAGPGRAKLVLSDAEYTFFPLWNVEANQVFAYLCRAAWPGPGGEPLTEGSPEIRGAAAERLAAIDLGIFRAGTSFVQNALDNYGSVDVVIPIHCGVFASPRAVSSLFGTVGREIWPVLENIFFELIPEPAPDSFRHVEALVAQLASYGCRVMLRVDAGDDLSAVPAADWLSIGLEPSWSTGDDEAIPPLDAFADRLRDLGYAAHVFGLAGTPATVGAINAGFAYVGSDAIAPPLTGEDDAQAQPADILRAILASKAAR